MLPPEAVDLVVKLSLWAIVIGSGIGFICSRSLERLIDLALFVLQRRERIDAARHRDHSSVPAIK